MNNDRIKVMALNAMIAALYAVMTVMITPLAYGEIQLRISEVMVLLAFYNRKYIPGLVVGCFVANMFSPMGMLDMVFGTLATTLACLAFTKLKNCYVAVSAGAIINGLIIGAELVYAFQVPFILTAIYVALGEFIALLLGVFLFKALLNNKKLVEFLELR